MFTKASMLRQFSNSCLDLEELDDENTEVLEQLSPSSRGRRIVGFSLGKEETGPMPPTPPGRGRKELQKTFSGSCLELDEMALGPDPPSGPTSPLSGGRHSPLYNINDTRQIIDYVHVQNSRKRAIDSHRHTTVLVTGAGTPGSGYLATHIIARLLHEGYAVHATIRDPSQASRLADETKSSSRATLQLFTVPDLQAGLIGELEEAMVGVDYVIHCPGGAVGGMADGVRRLWEGMGMGVRRVVMTSTVLAVNEEGVEGPLDERNWNSVSKEEDPVAWARVEAERVAWSLSEKTRIPLVTIVPSTVIGSSMGGEVSESMRVVRDLLFAPWYFPFAPQTSRNLVSVEDVASAHCSAIETDSAANQRFIVAGGSYTLSEIGQVIKTKFPGFPVPTRSAWNWVTLLVVPTLNTGITRASLLQQLAQGKAYNTSKVRETLKLTIRNPDTAIISTVEDLISRGQIPDPEEVAAAASENSVPIAAILCGLGTVGVGAAMAVRFLRKSV